MTPLESLNEKTKLCVLITNTLVANYTGSELYVRDVAIELRKRGHTPIVYSPRLGELAHEIRGAAVPVVDDLKSIGTVPDLIHGQHHLETMTALSRFPGVPAVYFCHGWLPWEETPPHHRRILRYVAVSDVIRDRLVCEYSVPEEKIVTLLSFVDMERFKPRVPLPPLPQRALVFSNQASEYNYVTTVREACRRYGISLDVIGLANGNAVPQPEAVLGDYDIIFARGRAALESLAVGATVVCCDLEGCGPMVTSGNLEWLRRNNFGLRILNQPITADVLSEEISRYDASDALRVSQAIRTTAGLSCAVDGIVNTYLTTLAAWIETEPTLTSTEQDDVFSYLDWMSRSVPKHLVGSVKNLRAQIEQIAGERHGFWQQVCEQQTEMAALRDQVSRPQLEIADLRDQVSRQQLEIAALRQQSAQQQAELDGIHESITWQVFRRVTSWAPVRLAHRLVVCPLKRWRAG